MKIKCPAKINLFLKIAGLRQDNFHELQTLFAFLNLHDELDIVPAEKFSLKISGPFASLIDKDLENNLITKAVKLFEKKFALKINLQIKLTKNIPIGGGLGGGSSDAAALMKILNKIYQLNLTKIELQKISCEFGSDIALFFENQACLMFGRGEILQRHFHFADLPVLVVNPNIHIATPKIFQKLRESFDYKNLQKLGVEDLQNEDVIFLAKKFGNDLTRFAVDFAPEISVLINKITEQKNCQIAAMSGSGASCFGIFTDEKTRDLAFLNLQKIFPDYFLLKTKIVSSL